MTDNVPVAVLAALLAAGAALAWPHRTRRTLARLGRVCPWRSVSATATRSPRLPVHGLAAVGGGIGVTLFVGMPWGVPLGVLATLIAHYVLGRVEPATAARRRARMMADLPVAVDLLAACHGSGGTPAAATEAVSKAVGGPVGDALHRVLALLRLGADPADAWSVLADEPTLAPLGRAVGRAVSSGAPISAALEQLAGTARQEQQAAAEEAARKVGVRATIPLGLCFLPAFVLLGVVPVAAGIATTLDLW